MSHPTRPTGSSIGFKLAVAAFACLGGGPELCLNGAKIPGFGIGGQLCRLVFEGLRRLHEIILIF